MVGLHIADGAGRWLLSAAADPVSVRSGRGGRISQCASVAVARWFPVHERGRAFGITLMAGQLGGAIAPLLVVPIQIHYGWRASFYVFGMVGVAWSAVWYGGSAIRRRRRRASAGRSWRRLAAWSPGRIKRFRGRSRFVPRICGRTMGVAFCYVYRFLFFPVLVPHLPGKSARLQRE